MQSFNNKEDRKHRRILAHLEAAKAYAKLSSARRLKVGAVLVKDDRVISVGYNGTPTGGSNCCEELVQDALDAVVWVTKPEVLHAEENCIAFAARNGIATDGCSMVTTHSPCFPCSRLLIQAGVKNVYYETEYRNVSGIELLKKHRVSVERLELDEEKGTTKPSGEQEADVSTSSSLSGDPQANSKEREETQHEDC